MTGHTHIYLGGATSLVVVSAAHVHAPAAGAIVATAIAVSRLPDEDLKVGLRHRGPTHTIGALALVTFLAYAVGRLWPHADPYAVPLAAGVAIGYGMHLVADMMTPRGLAVLSPLSARVFHLLPRVLWVRVGWREWAFRVLSAVVLFIYAWSVYG